MVILLSFCFCSFIACSSSFYASYKSDHFYVTCLFAQYQLCSAIIEHLQNKVLCLLPSSCIDLYICMHYNYISRGEGVFSEREREREREREHIDKTYSENLFFKVRSVVASCGKIFRLQYRCTFCNLCYVDLGQNVKLVPTY